MTEPTPIRCEGFTYPKGTSGRFGQGRKRCEAPPERRVTRPFTGVVQYLCEPCATQARKRSPGAVVVEPLKGGE